MKRKEIESLILEMVVLDDMPGKTPIDEARLEQVVSELEGIGLLVNGSFQKKYQDPMFESMRVFYDNLLSP